MNQEIDDDTSLKIFAIEGFYFTKNLSIHSDRGLVRLSSIKIENFFLEPEADAQPKTQTGKQPFVFGSNRFC